MKPNLLHELVTGIRSVKIAIIGDFCLDAYWFIDESTREISIETGQPTRPVRLQKYSLGGAGNVANNLAAMEVKDIRAFGVIGSDPFGAEMVSIMKKTGVDTRNLLIQDKEWSTHVYIKPYINEVEQSRIDFGNYNRLSEETANLLIDRINAEINEVRPCNYQSAGSVRNTYRILQTKTGRGYKFFPGKDLYRRQQKLYGLL